MRTRVTQITSEEQKYGGSSSGSGLLRGLWSGKSVTTRGEPLAGRGDLAEAADPLPQAFVLTAIVITLAVTIFMLALAVLGHDDDQKRNPETGEERDS